MGKGNEKRGEEELPSFLLASLLAKAALVTREGFECAL